MEKNCHDCYYATKINTDTYRCRRKKYDVEKKTCFVPRKEEVDIEREDLHETYTRASGKDGEHE